MPRTRSSIHIEVNLARVELPLACIKWFLLHRGIGRSMRRTLDACRDMVEAKVLELGVMENKRVMTKEVLGSIIETFNTLLKEIEGE